MFVSPRTAPCLSPGRRRSRILAVVATSACLAMLTAGPGASATRLPAGPGAPGIGDPYFPLDGNGGYDALHYGITVKVDKAVRRLEGTAIIDARATQGLTAFDLDLNGLTVSSVTVDGRHATWARSGQELTITPPGTIRRGARFVTVVRYHGSPTTVATPDGFDNGWFATSDGATAVGAPPSASTWFPVNEHPKDKALYDLTVTVPAGKTAVPNGLLTKGPSTVDGWTTFTWHHTHPMASYLVLLTIGSYDLRFSTTRGGLPIIDPVDPALGGVADAALAREGEVIATLEKSFGPYPFETAGAVVDQVNTGYALETQSRPFYSQDFFSGDPSDAWAVAHETAHQWFGDDVSLSDWSDVWLNEGFATYAEWLWAEHEGWLTPTQIFHDQWDNVPGDDPLWTLNISNPGPVDLFADPVYVKGAMVLQALREKVGDDAFFRILKQWSARHRDANGSTAQFVDLAERVSGQNLCVLFDTWLFGTGKPTAPPSSARDAVGRSRWTGPSAPRHMARGARR